MTFDLVITIAIVVVGMAWIFMLGRLYQRMADIRDHE